MTSPKPDVLVVGAGVSGLTTAVCLAEAGLAVAVRAERMPQQTTSAAAGAIWSPHLVEQGERTDRWSRATLARLAELAAEPASGVRIASGVTAARGPESAEPPPDALFPPPEAAARPPARVTPASWQAASSPLGGSPPGGSPPGASPLGGSPPADSPPGASPLGASPPGASPLGASPAAAPAAETGDGPPDRPHRCGPDELPRGFADGWRYAAPLISMPVYLEYLAGRLARLGVRPEAGAVVSLTAAAAEAGARAVVNCTGAAARDVAADPEVTPVRGQVVVVSNPGVEEFFIGAGDGGGIVYLFPHADRVVMGGTEDHDCWSTEPDPQEAKRILRDAAAIEPRLSAGQVLAHRAGLRPCRPRVRLDVEDPGDAPAGTPLIAHNYGHGGAGVTLSWGCAKEIAERIAGALS